MANKIVKDFEFPSSFGFSGSGGKTPVKGYMRGGAMKAPAKVGKVMHEFKTGTLHSGSKSGPKVTNRKQAVAIALSEARSGKKMADGGAVTPPMTGGPPVKNLGGGPLRPPVNVAPVGPKTPPMLGSRLPGAPGALNRARAGAPAYGLRRAKGGGVSTPAMEKRSGKKMAMGGGILGGNRVPLRARTPATGRGAVRELPDQAAPAPAAMLGQASAIAAPMLPGGGNWGMKKGGGVKSTPAMEKRHADWMAKHGAPKSMVREERAEAHEEAGEPMKRGGRLPKRGLRATAVSNPRRSEKAPTKRTLVASPAVRRGRFVPAPSSEPMIPAPDMSGALLKKGGRCR